MAAPGARTVTAHKGQISQLRDQLQSLASEHVAPALADAADSAAIPVQKLLGYAKLAAEVFPQLRQLVRSGQPAPEPVVRPRPGLLRRHPAIVSTLVIGLAFGAGLVAYTLIGTQRSWRQGRAS